jgi:hypothetical protein
MKIRELIPSTHMSNAALAVFPLPHWLPQGVGVHSCPQPTRGPLLVLVACQQGKATAVEGGVRVGTSWRSRMSLEAGLRRR